MFGCWEAVEGCTGTIVLGIQGGAMGGAIGWAVCGQKREQLTELTGVFSERGDLP